MIVEPKAGAISTPPEYSTRSYETLRMVIRSAADRDGPYFQIALRQRGSAAIGGPFRQSQAFRLLAMEALRLSYEQEARTMRQLAALGVPVPPQDLRGLIDLGRRIAAVLPQTVRHEIVAATQRAQRHGRGLRIVLEVGPDEAAKSLLGLPWELMVLPITRGAQIDTGGEGFLLLNADITLVRQVSGVGRNTTPAFIRPLVLQALAAAPEDGAPIELAATRAALEAALSKELIEGRWFAGHDTLGALQARLRQSSPQILHLLCHGELSDTGRGFRSDLLFTHSDGFVQRVSAFELTPALTLAPDLQLVILQACYAGATPAAGLATGALAGGEGERLAIESIALALVRHGVPAVVAMQGAVGQDAAATFVETCYQTLARGGSVDVAVATGRIAMRLDGALVDWSLPVIYQGSGLPDLETWYTRLADRLDAALHDPAARRSLRGGLVAIALTLLTVSLLRWLFLPPPDAPDLGWLATPLQTWALLGVAGPAVVAAAHRGVRDREDLAPGVRRAALLGQWMGAYLGYALGGALILGLLALLWIVGALQFVPVGWMMLLTGIALLGGLFVSYAAARAQVRSALAIAPFEPSLFGPGTLAVVMFAALAIAAAPLGILLLPSTPLAFLLDPAASALGLAIALITAALRG
jgi:hypothetical protein